MTEEEAEALTTHAAAEEEASFEVVEDEQGVPEPRSFASLMGESDTDEEPEVVDESLLVWRGRGAKSCPQGQRLRWLPRTRPSPRPSLCMRAHPPPPALPTPGSWSTAA